MTISLAGRVALVTGAGRGLGRAHAVALARHGARVIVNELDAGAADAVAAEIRAAGGEAIGHAASVTDPQAVEAMVSAATDRWGAVDILVNNAGILRDRSFAKMSLDEFRLVMDVHLMGAVHCSKAVWAGMMARGHGRIVFTTSSTGLYGNFGQANYGAAKMALVGLMQTLAIEGQRHDIRVNCLAPTAATEMTRGILPEAMLARLTADAVSPAVVVLASDAAPSRAILLAGGGHFAQAHVGMTQGITLAVGDGMAEALADRLDAVADLTGQTIPATGTEQQLREIADLEGECHE